jgi:hypothetical protein
LSFGIGGLLSLARHPCFSWAVTPALVTVSRSRSGRGGARDFSLP